MHRINDLAANQSHFQLSGLGLTALLALLVLSTGCTTGWTQRDGTELLDGDEQGTDDSGEDSQDESEDDSAQEDPVEEEEEEEVEEEDDTTEDPDPDPASEDYDGLVQGTWMVTTSELTHDGCGLTEHVDQGEAGSLMELLPTTEGNFDLTFVEDAAVTHCMMGEAPDFECQQFQGTDDRAADYGLDATILVLRNSWGSFASAQDLLLVSEVALECQGPDCNWINLMMGTSFPCSMTMESDFAPAQS